jgi:hypothetical protein
MQHMPLIIALAAVSALAATTASADTKRHARHVHHARAPAERAASPRPSFEPARIIEVRPGVFISSYGCITDDGYGRWSVCGQGRGGD